MLSTIYRSKLEQSGGQIDPRVTSAKITALYDSPRLERTATTKPLRSTLYQPAKTKTDPPESKEEADRRTMALRIEEAKSQLNAVEEANKILKTKIMGGNSLKKRLNEVYQKMCKYDQMGEKERRKVLKVGSKGDRNLPRKEGCLPAQLPDSDGEKLTVAVQKRLFFKHQRAEGSLIRRRESALRKSCRKWFSRRKWT